MCEFQVWLKNELSWQQLSPALILRVCSLALTTRTLLLTRFHRSRSTHLITMSYRFYLFMLGWLLFCIRVNLHDFQRFSILIQIHFIAKCMDTSQNVAAHLKFREWKSLLHKMQHFQSGLVILVEAASNQLIYSTYFTYKQHAHCNRYSTENHLPTPIVRI